MSSGPDGEESRTPAADGINAVWSGTAGVHVVEMTAAWFLRDAETTFPPLPKDQTLRQVEALRSRGMLPDEEAAKIREGLDAALDKAWAQMEVEGLSRADLEG